MKKLTLGLFHFIHGLDILHRGGTPPATPEDTASQFVPKKEGDSNPTNDFLTSDPVKELFADLESLIIDKLTGQPTVADIQKITEDIKTDLFKYIDTKIEAAFK
ncbi:hypothetical protein CJD36_003695 [Flavipsychrobacter stenotrophus]|uniref:Uncharacterized protein n=1 Tax=Flavipsychrobacter stenotrophus TaxID=2077091 RepID=A0A2S7T1Q2_9BACT|nr:hypothetical protein [Flavipsychrobacter stenotrophus]PQJ12858.1 hypothetical protein CJD36_003695 [Flavipsychrobacter stenotrophus]